VRINAVYPNINMAGNVDQKMHKILRWKLLKTIIFCWQTFCKLIKDFKFYHSFVVKVMIAKTINTILFSLVSNGQESI
jgi:hypothetical protein